MASLRKVDIRYTVSHPLWSSCCQVFSSAGAHGITIPLSHAQVTNWKLAGAAAPDNCQAAAMSRHGSGLHVGDLSSEQGAVAPLHKGITSLDLGVGCETTCISLSHGL